MGNALIPPEIWAVENTNPYFFEGPCPTCSAVVEDRVVHREWHIAMVEFAEKRGGVLKDTRWDRPCSLMGCPQRTRAHHHHVNLGHLTTTPCYCERVGQPGTKVPSRNPVGGYIE